eukprot:scaffold107530_cov52-Prasinocladus_malaysianus.AAC.1
MQGDGDDNGNAGGWICLDMIYEQYLDGPEVDVDIVLSEGKPVYGAVSDNWCVHHWAQLALLCMG